MKRTLRLLFAVSVCIFVLAMGCNPATRSLKVTPKYREKVAQVISNSGENAIELRAFLNMYKEQREKLEAASFLVANMPHCDAVSMSADDLREHIDNAFHTRDTMAWGKNVPWNVFLHYIVPHRVSQERPERYRKQFYDELAPVISRYQTMYEAALEINKWCFLKATYKGSSPRDQGPIATILRGIGRCEEEMILYISAARSVGIPARQCYTPRWQSSDSNHAWVEVWADGAWYYLGGCEPAKKLNSAWFTEPTKRAVVVVSTAYGQVNSSDEIVQRAGDTYTTINSTHVYALPCQLAVNVIGEDGKPLPNAKVYASVFNYGTMYPVVSMVCDENGMAHQVFGKTTVLLTTSHEGMTDFVYISTDPSKPAVATLDVRRNRLPQGRQLLTFGSGPKAVSGSKSDKHPELNFELDKGAIEKARHAKFAGYKKQIADYFGFDVNNAEMWKKPLYSQLIIAGGNAAEFIKAHASCDPAIKATLETYIENMEDKDLLEARGQDIINDVTYALLARKEMSGKTGFGSYDEPKSDEFGAGSDPSDRRNRTAEDSKNFNEYVLNNRVFYEPYTCYRPELYRRFKCYVADSLMQTVARVNEYTAMLTTVPGSSFGNLLTPLDVVRSNAVVDRTEGYDRAVVAVAILRSLGIPARYVRDLNIVEFMNKDGWCKFFPTKPEALGNEAALEAGEKPVTAYGDFSVQFTLDGVVLDAKKHPYESFSISKFTEYGYFTRVDCEGEFDEKSNTYKFKVREGDYYLITAKRNSLGEPEVHFIPFTANGNKPVSLKVELALEKQAGLPIVRNLRSIPALTGKTVTGVDFDLAASLKAGKKILVVFFDPSTEPCVNMMPVIGAMMEEYPEINFIGVAEKGSASSYASFVKRHCPKLDYIIDADGAIAGNFKADRYPSILVLNPDGSIVMWHEGHNLQIADLLHEALKK